MTRVFDAYARYYDLLYRDKDYAGEAQYVASLIEKHNPAAKRILELGCGTGGHAAHLAAMGYTVHGIDMSDPMLARANARKAALPPDVSARLSFEQGDVRAARLGETFDVVISLFHVMSYQVTNVDIEAAIFTASSHLDTGGIFIFDIWYSPAVITLRPETRVKRFENEAIMITRIAEPTNNWNENAVDVNYTIFVEDKKTEAIERIAETHSMRHFSLPEMQALLTGSGLRASNALTWMEESSPDLHSWSIVITASK